MSTCVYNRTYCVLPVATCRVVQLDYSNTTAVDPNLCEFVYSVSCVFVEGPLYKKNMLSDLLCAISFVYLRQMYSFQKTSDCIRVENSFVTDMSYMHEFRSKLRASLLDAE
eukprot:COSAG05_NODE_4380_length_1539_cov_32.520139_2_plen_111_part_00